MHKFFCRFRRSNISINTWFLKKPLSYWVILVKSAWPFGLNTRVSLSLVSTKPAYQGAVEPICERFYHQGLWKKSVLSNQALKKEDRVARWEQPIRQPVIHSFSVQCTYSCFHGTRWMKWKVSAAITKDKGPELHLIDQYVMPLLFCCT